MLSCKPAAHFLPLSELSCSALLTLYIKSEEKKEENNILIYGCKQLVNKVFMWMQYRNATVTGEYCLLLSPHAVAQRHLVLAGGRRNICSHRATYAFRGRTIKPGVIHAAQLSCHRVPVFSCSCCPCIHRF